jgi:hypothetical protein
MERFPYARYSDQVEGVTFQPKVITDDQVWNTLYRPVSDFRTLPGLGLGTLCIAGVGECPNGARGPVTHTVRNTARTVVHTRVLLEFNIRSSAAFRHERAIVLGQDVM